MQGSSELQEGDERREDANGLQASTVAVENSIRTSERAHSKSSIVRISHPILLLLRVLTLYYYVSVLL
jgi:hypothetical protein